MHGSFDEISGKLHVQAVAIRTVGAAAFSSVVVIFSWPEQPPRRLGSHPTYKDQDGPCDADG